MNARALGRAVMAAVMALLVPASASAQLGIGPRLAFVRGTEGSDEGHQRYFGGALRLGSGKTVLELALDYRSESHRGSERIASPTIPSRHR